MTARRPRDIGTDAERAVERFLQANGWPQAEKRRLRGRLDAGDITGTPGICWEVKGGDAARTASDRRVAEWLTETEIERANAGADLGVLVLQRRSIGPARAGEWWAITTLATLTELTAVMIDAATYHAPAAPIRLLLGDLVRLLHAAGYGSPAPDAEVAEHSTAGQLAAGGGGS
jgi:hypothetical protein